MHGPHGGFGGPRGFGGPHFGGPHFGGPHFGGPMMFGPPPPLIVGGPYYGGYRYRRYGYGPGCCNIF